MAILAFLLRGLLWGAAGLQMIAILRPSGSGAVVFAAAWLAGLAAIAAVTALYRPGTLANWAAGYGLIAILYLALTVLVQPLASG